MPNRAASNASARCGADATTTTAASPIGTSPTRCSSTSRPSSGQRRRASAAMAGQPGHDVLLVGLVLQPLDAGPAVE